MSITLGLGRRGRRWVFAILSATIALGLLALGIAVLAPGGWSPWEVLILICLAANTPWIALAGATGLIGLVLRLDDAGAEAAADAPVVLRTVLAVCVRSEAMEQVLPPLLRLREGLAGYGDRFVLAVLSDTSDPIDILAEEAAIRRCADALPPGSLLYRRRLDNSGYKAGNVMEFLDHHTKGFDLFVPLDADSGMTPEAVLRLVRAMQSEPRLGILQHPIAGSEARAPFGRFFNLGHRAGARTWTLGQDWWQDDEGPFWGHNAAIRIAPFQRHCRLSPLLDGSHILSHDHVEAARLHAAGWAVRVLPDIWADAGGSLEAPPPHLLAFLTRDQRWAAGNLQYRHLLRDRSLGRVGRFQMLQAILHYLLAPLWFALLPLAALNAALDAEGTPRGELVVLLLLGYAALHMPRLAGHAANLIAAVPGDRLSHLHRALADTGFLALFDPIIAFHNTKTVLFHLLGLPHAGWPAQQREERRLAWGEAARFLWPHTLAGLIIVGLLGMSGSAFATTLGLIFTAGLVLAIPFAVLTSNPNQR